MNGRDKCESLPLFCREWRESEGYTQEYIGVKCGVTRSFISRFESGEKHSINVLYGYLSLGMPLPLDLIRQEGYKIWVREHITNGEDVYIYCGSDSMKL